MHPARRGLRPGSRMRSSAIRNHGAVRRKHRTPRRPDAFMPFPASIRDKACSGQRPEYAPYRASDSVPERTDRARRHPIPPRHPHRKIRKSGDKFLSPLFRIRFFSRRDSGLHLRKERQKLRDGIRLRTLPLRPKRPPHPVVFLPSSSFRSMRFRTTRLPISTLFSGKSRQTFPSLSDSRTTTTERRDTLYRHTTIRRTGRPGSQPGGKQFTPDDRTKRRKHPAESLHESIRPCRETSQGKTRAGRTSTARPPAAGRSEKTVRNIIKIIEKRMERKRSTAGLICGKHGPSPDGCPSP